MERSRIIAIACAVIAAVCVIIAGKSCTDDAIKERNRNRETAGTAVSEAAQTEAVTRADKKTGGNASTSDSAEDGTKETEYDLFGNIITTAPETTAATDSSEDETEPDTYETDNFGLPVETAPDLFGGDADDEPTTAPPVISGYNHGEYDDEGNTIPPKPTLPPDFTLIIE